MGAGVIAGPGTHYQLAMAFGFGFYADLAEASSTFGSGWFVADGVLVADVISDSAADRVHFVQSLGKEGDSACSLAENVQGFLGAPGMLFVAENADGIDCRAVLVLQLLYRLL